MRMCTESLKVYIKCAKPNKRDVPISYFFLALNETSQIKVSTEIQPGKLRIVQVGIGWPYKSA